MQSNKTKQKLTSKITAAKSKLQQLLRQVYVIRLPCFTKTTQSSENVCLNASEVANINPLNN